LPAKGGKLLENGLAATSLDSWGALVVPAIAMPTGATQANIARECGGVYDGTSAAL